MPADCSAGIRANSWLSILFVHEVARRHPPVVPAIDRLSVVDGRVGFFRHHATAHTQPDDVVAIVERVGIEPAVGRGFAIPGEEYRRAKVRGAGGDRPSDRNGG